MTDIDMILKMSGMQAELDDALFKKGKALGKIKEDEFDFENFERCQFALIDELGELVHELKGDWCWWKATQKPVDRQKVLEELVDCWHFGLSLDNNNDEHQLCDWKIKKSDEITIYCIHKIIDNAICGLLTIKPLYNLTYSLGFTMEEVYQGYIRKNKINHERIANGY